MNTWAQQPGESDRDFLAFQLWLAREYSPTPWKFDKRDIAKLAAYLGRDPGELTLVSVRRQWEARAAAFDQSTLQRKLLGQSETTAEFNRRRKRILDAGLDLLEESIAGMKAKLASGKAGVSVKEISSLAATILSFEDKARLDQQEETGAFLDSFDLSGLSDEELQTLATIASKAKKR